MESGICCKNLSSNGAPSEKLCRFMEGTSSYGFQRHKLTGTEATTMEHRVSFRDKICFLDMIGLDIGSVLWIWSVLEIGYVLWILSVVEI
jgi:hypothetical protein